MLSITTQSTPALVPVVGPAAIQGLGQPAPDVQPTGHDIRQIERHPPGPNRELAPGSANRAQQRRGQVRAGPGFANPLARRNCQLV